jgi:hypothetical protein
MRRSRVFNAKWRCSPLVGPVFFVLLAQQAVSIILAKPDEMLVGLGLPRPPGRCRAVQFVGSWRRRASQDARSDDRVHGWIDRHVVTFVPSLWIFAGGPYVEAARNKRLNAALSAVTAAVVGAS